MLMRRWLRGKYDAPQEGPGLEMGPASSRGLSRLAQVPMAGIQAES